ncbi:hypothetical protein MHYP_G00287100 [Metynnis hypsauchen]
MLEGYQKAINAPSLMRPATALIRSWERTLGSELHLDTEQEDFTDGRGEALAFSRQKSEERGPDFTPKRPGAIPLPRRHPQPSLAYKAMHGVLGSQAAGFTVATSVGAGQKLCKLQVDSVSPAHYRHVLQPLFMLTMGP